MEQSKCWEKQLLAQRIGHITHADSSREFFIKPNNIACMEDPLEYGIKLVFVTVLFKI